MPLHKPPQLLSIIQRIKCKPGVSCSASFAVSLLVTFPPSLPTYILCYSALFSICFWIITYFHTKYISPTVKSIKVQSSNSKKRYNKWSKIVTLVCNKFMTWWGHSWLFFSCGQLSRAKLHGSDFLCPLLKKLEQSLCTDFRFPCRENGGNHVDYSSTVL